MKRKIIIVVLALASLLQMPVFAADAGKKVTVNLPAFNVTLNGVKIESTYDKYPLIVYKDITYFPMTYHASRFMHLKANYYEPDPTFLGTLFVGYAEQSEDTWTPYPADKKNKATDTAVISEISVAVNTLDQNEFIDNAEEQYPLLNFRGVTYFPLTWRFAAEEFGWDYGFDAKTGLTINAKEQFRPELEDEEYLSSTSPSRALRLKSFVYDAAHTEYAGYPYTNRGSFSYRRQGEETVSFDAMELFSDGEYTFNARLDDNGSVNIKPEQAPALENGILTIWAVRTNGEGCKTVLLKIDLRQKTVLQAS